MSELSATELELAILNREIAELESRIRGLRGSYRLISMYSSNRGILNRLHNQQQLAEISKQIRPLQEQLKHKQRRKAMIEEIDAEYRAQ